LALRNSSLWYCTDECSQEFNGETGLERRVVDFPFIDYGAENKFSIVRATIENDGRYDNDVGAYPMLTSRGVLACTFCHNSTVHDLYRGQKYCRQRALPV
jgi:hypothetical protein